MELATIFLIWLVVEILDKLAKRKKRRLPPPEQSPEIDIPTLANDPNAEPLVIESTRQAEVRQMPPRRPQRASAQIHEAEEQPKRLNVNLTRSEVMNAFVMSEIIGKPKALRRR